MSARKTFVYGTVNDAIENGDVDYVKNLLELGLDWEGDRYIDLDDVKYPKDSKKFALLLKLIFDLKLYNAEGSFSPISYYDDLENSFGDRNVVDFSFFPKKNHFDEFQLSETISQIAQAFVKIFDELICRKNEKPEDIIGNFIDPGILIHVNDHDCYTVVVLDYNTWKGEKSFVIIKWAININAKDLLVLFECLSGHLSQQK